MHTSTLIYNRTESKLLTIYYYSFKNVSCHALEMPPLLSDSFACFCSQSPLPSGVPFYSWARQMWASHHFKMDGCHMSVITVSKIVPLSAACILMSLYHLSRALHTWSHELSQAFKGRLSSPVELEIIERQLFRSNRSLYTWASKLDTVGMLASMISTSVHVTAYYVYNWEDVKFPKGG